MIKLNAVSSDTTKLPFLPLLRYLFISRIAYTIANENLKFRTNKIDIQNKIQINQVNDFAFSFFLFALFNFNCT